MSAVIFCRSLVRYSWGIKETKTNIKHKTNSEFAIRSPKIIGLLILIYSSKFDNKSLVKISKFDMIKIKCHRNALSNNGKALIRERFCFIKYFFVFILLELEIKAIVCYNMIRM